MKITKYGHACVLIEEGSARILIDPGSYSKDANPEDLDAILITHTHQDHMDPELIQHLIAKSPNAQIIAVSEVVKQLADIGIEASTIEDGTEVMIVGISVRSFGRQHSFIYGDQPQCQNTGFMIADRFYHPGDSFHIPEVLVEILALPVAGPWMKIAEAIDYAKTVKPNVAIPMHDAFYKESGMQMVRGFARRILEAEGVTFSGLADGESVEFDP